MKLGRVKRKSILVVDEDPTSITSLQQMLSNSLLITQATRGQHALQLVKSAKPDLVIIADHLPDMSGVEFIKTLHAAFPTIPLVFVSKRATNDLIVSAFRTGAQDFVKKPFEAAELQGCLDRIFQACVRGGERPFPHFWMRIRSMLVNTLSEKLLPNKRRTNRSGLSHIAAEKETSEIQTVHEQVALSPLPCDSGTKREAQKPVLRVRCLGKLHVKMNNHNIEMWPSRKGKLLFAYLVMNHTRRVTRDVLMDKFWPASDPESARNCLNVAMHGMRQKLREIDADHCHIFFKDECYFINPEMEVWLDVEVFKKLWRCAQNTERREGLKPALMQYEQAAKLYGGEFLEEFPYDNWAALERENLKEIYLVVLDRISKYYSQNGNPGAAIDLCETILAKDNCREEIYRRLMVCHYRLGQRDKALKQFNRCQDVLKAELEAGPTRATLRLYEQIKQNTTRGKHKPGNFSKN